jgi:coiled-coil domain-containing protein 12
MSLAEASEARKARLLALKRRKAGEETHSNSYVPQTFKSLYLFAYYWLNDNFSDEPVIKSRNFDPTTRTLRKHDRTDDVVMQDTVEQNVDGLAERIIAEDEERRAQELVCRSSPVYAHNLTSALAGHLQHRAKATELGFKT